MFSPRVTQHRIPANVDPGTAGSVRVVTDPSLAESAEFVRFDEWDVVEKGPDV